MFKTKNWIEKITLELVWVKRNLPNSPIINWISLKQFWKSM